MPDHRRLQLEQKAARPDSLKAAIRNRTGKFVSYIPREKPDRRLQARRLNEKWKNRAFRQKSGKSNCSDFPIRSGSLRGRTLKNVLSNPRDFHWLEKNRKRNCRARRRIRRSPVFRR